MSAKKIQQIPTLIAFLSLVILIFIILQYTEFNQANKEKDVKAGLFELLIGKKALIEKALNSRIYYTKGIAAYTSINPDITNDEFYGLAAELIQDDTVISTMSISKDCIIDAIFPIEGHESAIGLNLLAHPFRKTIVEKTIETHNTFIAGPVELVEGGIAFISYTPIFTRVEKAQSDFWGVTDIVIWKNKLFNELNFREQDDNYKYALRGVDGTGIDGKCFFGDDDIFNHDPVMVDILLPTGSWKLASIPINGWSDFIDDTELLTVFLYISAVIISLLIWLLSRAIIKIRAHERELNALFGSMQDIIIEFNKNGEYVKIAPTNDALLVKPRQELLGKKLHEVFNKEKADYFIDAITECLETKGLVVLDYPLIINNEKLWFQARLSYLSDDSVMYVAHDNTKKKLFEEQLVETGEKLKELNATKDKLFSIIAHDLRGPFNTTLGLAEILTEDFDTLSEKEKKDYIREISEALHSQYKLLENLLDWSRMQTERMAVKRETINLFEFTNKVIDILTPSAAQKDIEIINNVEKDGIVLADENMLRSIIYNLIANSIKFTHSKGKIVVSSKIINGVKQITVSDTGVGIENSDLEKLFRLDTQHSTHGTIGERGTGLGLPLIKEMIEKHNGTIWAESEPGKGSDFSFTLPDV